MSKEIKLQLTALHPAQLQVTQGAKRFNVVCCGRRWGKTQYAKSEILRAAAIPNQLVWYVAPTYRMAKQIMWRDLMATIPRAYIVKSNETALDITLQRCPLKEAWQEAGVADADIAALCRIAGRVDNGTFEAAGFEFSADTWQPGRDGCCHLHVRPGRAH